MKRSPYKIAYTVTEAADLAPFGKTKLYELIGEGALPVRKQFGRSYVMHEDLMAVLLSVEPANKAA